MTQTDHTEHSEHKEESLKTYLVVFTTLMVLLVLTVGVYEIDFSKVVIGGVRLGFMNLAIAMFIAIIKALMVILIFMHVRLSSKLVWVFAASAFLWLSIM